MTENPRTRPWSVGPGREDRDIVLDALAHPDRRRLLGYLDGMAETATVTELAAVLAAPAERQADQEAARDVDTIETSLYHAHLPKLEEAGLVEFAEASETVTATERIDLVTPILNSLEDL